MSWWTNVRDAVTGTLFGTKGEVQTQEVPKWTTEQQALFKQLFGEVTPELGKGLTPTNEEYAYGDSLRNYESMYRSLMGESYNPAIVDQAYGGQADQINKIYDPSSVSGIYDPARVSALYNESQLGNIYDPSKLRGVYDPSKVASLYDPQATKDYFSKVVMPEFEQTAVPKIQSQFAGPGYWGSARARAVGDAYAGMGRTEATALYDVENQRRRAVEGVYGEERGALASLFGEERGARAGLVAGKIQDLSSMSAQERTSLMGLDTARRSALLMSDENRRTQVLDLQKKGQTALADLATKLPVTNQTLAAWSRSFSPEQSPYLQMALTMLGLQPFDTVAGYQPAQPGFIQAVAGGLGNKVGQAAGGNLSAALGIGG